MTDPVVPIRFTKKVLPAEPRRSKQITDAHLKDLRNAILTASRVSSFYMSHIEKAKAEGKPVNIMPRDAMQILSQMGNQKLYVCERTDRADPEIVASSIMWDTEMPVPSAVGHRGFATENFLEIGTQVSELRGFGFQRILTAVTLIEQLSFDPIGTVFAATYGKNAETSVANYSGPMRFVRWTDIPPTLESVRLHHLEEGGPDEVARGVNWFRPTIQSVITAAELIIDLNSNPVRPGSHSVNQIIFTFDQKEFKLVSFEDILEFSRKIAREKPRTLADLREVAVNRAISDNFLYWPV